MIREGFIGTFSKSDMFKIKMTQIYPWIPFRIGKLKEGFRERNYRRFKHFGVIENDYLGEITDDCRS